MADINKMVDDAKEKVKDIADDVAYKVRNYDYEALKEELKGLDTGVAYTKFLDAIKDLDLESKKQAIIDFMDSPAMEQLKGKGRTVKDFMGYVPYYAQSVPEMVKELFEGKEKK